ncbi:GIY-YIG nuclease family protein [Novosphingobium sp.]|uniref:GIY-YIG nuclease family protein n=1 Tax=Novosphingobium sp. TaxID=1874826 RepID=UPI0025E5763D|nr:GIY-YIG nuclease family protein [Novosphingobium sp.]
MMFYFTDILSKSGLALSEVRLLRHQTKAPNGRTPYLLWRDKRDAFEEYQSVQAESNRAKLSGRYWASFVAPPTGGTLFSGLYVAELVGASPKEKIDPLYERPDGDRYDGNCDSYRLTLSPLLSNYIGKLWVEWGLGARSWIQRADRQDKPIVQLTREFREEEFPGYTHFISNISDIPTLPRGWLEALKAACGVYLLASARTGEWYVGSATSKEGGFHARWLNYSADGHGGNIGLKSAEPSDYQVTILEVCGSVATYNEILETEQLWKRKLQSRDMGLNRN